MEANFLSIYLNNTMTMFLNMINGLSPNHKIVFFLIRNNRLKTDMLTCYSIWSKRLAGFFTQKNCYTFQMFDQDLSNIINL